MSVPSWQKEILSERERLIHQGKATFRSWKGARKRLSEEMQERRELLANPDAVKTLNLAKAGKLKYRKLADVESELNL